VGDIDSVVFRAYCTSLDGVTATNRLRSATTVDNWGATLQANAADWNSTDVYLEDENTITGTGWWEFAVDKTHLDLSGTTYFRLSDIAENDGLDANVYWASQDAASNRPVLRITLLATAIVIDVDDTVALSDAFSILTRMPPGTEKEIVSASCSEKTIPATPCTERVISSTSRIGKIIPSYSMIEKTVVSVSSANKTLVSYVNTEKVIQ
jgi:hypothetical protein